MNESEIQAFWDRHPCGEELVGSRGTELAEFFDRYDEYRYRTEAHIPRCLDEIAFRDKDTLEIGLGQGADSEQIIRRGARWSGVDLTPESIARVEARLALRELPYQRLVRGSVLELPFADRSFDIVYSHGVLHHVPDIHRAQREIHRVLRPGGVLIAMLYAKYSVNYLLSISLLRRAGLLALYPLGERVAGITGEHIGNARRQGLFRYLRMRNFVHRNTDGPGNPYSKVYSIRAARRDFPGFTVRRAFKRFMHAPPLPLHGWPGEGVLGWHLWLHLTPRGPR